MRYNSRVALFVVACLLFVSFPAQGDETASEPTGREQTIAQQLFDAINELRIRSGLPPLSMSPALNAAASIQSRDMVTHDFFDHINPVDGHNRPQDRALAAGYPSTFIAENLFMSMGSADEEIAALCFRSWSESAGHLANMLDAARTEIGVGVASNDLQETYITVVFGRP